MTMTTAGPVATARTTRRHWRLSPSASFFLQASMLVSLLTASSAPTPLYSVYRAEWVFSPITIAVVFGIYAIAVLAALLVVGKLSDHVGRRPVLVAAVLVQFVALAVFITSASVTDLIIARVFQGLSTGAAAGALGAAMLDVDEKRGTIANGISPVTGTATGSLLSGIFVQYLPSPTHLIYFALIGVFSVQLVGVLVMPETSSPKPGALASLKPEIALPPAVRRPMLIAVPALFAVWSLASFYGSLGPTLVARLSGSGSFVLGGLSLTILAGAAAVSTYFVRAMDAERLMVFGAMALLAGMAGTLVSVEAGSTVGFFLATTVAGVGFGGGFQGALRLVVPLARPHERAGVISSVYVVSYLALGVPGVGAGVLALHLGLLTTAREYTLFVMALAATALVATLARIRARRPAVLTSAGDVAGSCVTC